MKAPQRAPNLVSKRKWDPQEGLKRQELIEKGLPCTNAALERSFAQDTSIRYVHASRFIALAFQIQDSHFRVALFCLQVWEDVRKPQGVHNEKTGPLGTTDKCV